MNRGYECGRDLRGNGRHLLPMNEYYWMPRVDVCVCWMMRSWVLYWGEYILCFIVYLILCLLRKWRSKSNKTHIQEHHHHHHSIVYWKQWSASIRRRAEKRRTSSIQIIIQLIYTRSFTRSFIHSLSPPLRWSQLSISPHPHTFEHPSSTLGNGIGIYNWTGEYSNIIHMHTSTHLYTHTPIGFKLNQWPPFTAITETQSTPYTRMPVHSPIPPSIHSPLLIIL